MEAERGRRECIAATSRHGGRMRGKHRDGLAGTCLEKRPWPEKVPMMAFDYFSRARRFVIGATLRAAKIEDNA
jgi:hypothetical protein